ncbi:MAG: GNAT family N-acetyltransferase [Pseudomonadales bacterium]
MPDNNELYRTRRLIARRLDRDDVDSMHAVYGNAAAMRWVDDGSPLDRGGCARWIDITLNNYARRGYGMVALVERNRGRVVGFCGIVHPGGQAEPEIKYALLESRWGQGFATEAVIGMLDFAANHLGLASMMATTAPENRASHRVLEKAGMIRAELRQEDDGTLTQVFRWRAPTGSGEAPSLD